ncbi:cyclic-di-AMP phosphodiesterase PgpH [Siminovitchia terrae]|uniref:Cyclic-di-AMP phosphodiesterase PgpH n=1 Tax=Siminovitchia terrae TaxID=1914933 RepID=A0A429XDF3_SIMTE|nr:HD family phosphohydrolase [Siminovitchia terrae]RST61478.1 HD family phosphohydrolase [Siminovitchia terrae]GIN89656.1 cyclic-di-AMP phosphodiesterase PgpH [Siminovitchia terrae]GIN96319.1 cyclic-di-AMP phosphodiesterase PgpH [Siminovitchia terrae]
MYFQKYIKNIRKILSYKLFTALVFLVLGLLLFAILYTNVKPETYDMELFSVADKTIRSPKTIEDEEKTAEERKKAAGEVEDVYVYKKEVAQNRVLLLTSIFDFVNEVNQEGSDKKKKEEEEGKTEKESTQLTASKLALLKSKLTADVTEDVTETISDQTLTQLLAAGPDELEKARSILINNVEAIMNDKIREDQANKIRSVLIDRIKSANLDKNVENASIELGKYAIIANEVFDSGLTEERKQQAMDEVEPVKILQGQIVVQEGHLIDRDIYRQLDTLGLLKGKPSVKPFIGLAIFVLLSIGAIYIPFTKLKEPEEKKQSYLLIFGIVFVGAILVMKLISLVAGLDQYDISYVFPAAMAPMLIRVMVNERFGLLMAIILAACGSIVFHDGISGTIDVEIALYILFSGLAGIIFLSDKNERFNLLRAGMLVSVVNVLLIFFLQFIGSGQMTNMEYVYFIINGAVSGILSAVLTMGILPFLEAGFGILSTMRLIELSNPNHPLLKKILIEAPGTYHHSVMVANLAELACEAIGANGLLARVGAYYHDIGKTTRPHFFIENQMNMENPHNKLEPATSKDIIIAHVTDGVAELKKHKMPKEIVDIAEQHHGTTLLKFFYYKAVEIQGDVEESDYRYPGPKPQFIEAAVISLADCVEAAVRSLNQPTPEAIKSLVDSIVQDRLLDGQLNECDITMKQLEIIKTTFCETLGGIFHSRIEYPK